MHDLLTMSSSLPHQVGLAQEAFLRGGEPAGAEARQGLTPEAKLQAALMSWRFPDTHWDADTIRALLQVGS